MELCKVSIMATMGSLSRSCNRPCIYTYLDKKILPCHPGVQLIQDPLGLNFKTCFIMILSIVQQLRIIFHSC